MFAQQSAPPSNFFGFAAFSVALHAAVVLAVAYFVVPKPPPVVEKPREVALSLGVAPPPPPPPPPAGPSRPVTPKVEKKPKTEVRKPDVIKPVQEVKPVEPEPTPEPEPETPEPEAPPVEGGVAGGVVGGVAGGVVGGVVGGVEGGVVGGTLGGTGTAVKPKNVPPFVIQRDVVRQTPPRLSEVFKQSHRGQTVHGVYKVCVATDGRVYEVTPVKSVPGADEDIIQGLKDGWEYKPQKVPVCFLYNIPITIQ